MQLCSTEVFGMLKDIAVAGAAVATVTIAWRGLSVWRDELSGRAYFDVARDLAKATYRLRDEVQMCRSPFVAAAEFPNDDGDVNGSEIEGRKWAYVYKNRWSPVYLSIQSFDAAALEAEALWGAEVRAKTDALRHCVHKLKVSIDMYIENKFADDREKFDRGLERRIQLDIGSTNPQGEEINTLSEEIDIAISDIERELKSHLARY